MTPKGMAQAVCYLRKRSGLSQKELAVLAGVGKTAVFDIEKGKETVQLNTLLRVLDVLNVQIKFATPFVRSKENKV